MKMAFPKQQTGYLQFQTKGITLCFQKMISILNLTLVYKHLNPKHYKIKIQSYVTFVFLECYLRYLQFHGFKCQIHTAFLSLLFLKFFFQIFQYIKLRNSTSDSEVLYNFFLNKDLSEVQKEMLSLNNRNKGPLHLPSSADGASY